MKKLVKTFLIFVLLISFTSIKTQKAVGQQAGVIIWSGETVLRQGPEKGFKQFFPVIVADAYGSVHIFWREGSTIYYVQKNSAGWMLPIDVVYVPEGVVQFLSAAIDQKGILHLVYDVYGAIYYKSVPAWQAEQVKHWTKERIIGTSGGINTPMQIGIDPENDLHIIFADWNGKEGQTIPGNVYHFSSIDEGKTWSDYHQVSQVPAGDVATNPRMAFDDRGRIHIVWGQMTPDLDGLQQGVFYSRLSISDAVTVPPTAIDVHEEDDKWMMAINVAVSHGDEIYAVWTCGDHARRCQSRSVDGGDTWAAPQHVFGDLVGLSGWDAMFSDGSGNLYWMGVLRVPQAMYYSPLTETGVKDPPLIASQDTNMKLGENVMVTVGLGNEIHAVINLGDKIVYMAGLSSVMGIAPIPRPALSGITPEVTQTSAPHNTSEMELEPTTILPPAQSDQPIDLSSNRRIFSISILAVIATLTSVIGVILLKRRSV